MKSSPHSSEERFAKLHTIGPKGKPLITSEIAYILEVSSGSVNKAFSNRAIRGMWTIPPANLHLRISLTDLDLYMRKTSHPNAGIFIPKTVELTNDNGDAGNSTLRCGDAFSMGLALETQAVKEIIIDPETLPHLDPAILIGQIRNRFAHAGIPPPPIRVIDSYGPSSPEELEEGGRN